MAVEAAHENTFFLTGDGRIFFTPVSEGHSASNTVVSSRRIVELRLEEPLGCRRTASRPRVVQLSANIWDSSAIHLLALTNTGAVYASGCGEHGALGRGSANSETRLKPVLILGGGANAPFVVNISAGGRHSAAVTREGHLYTWGCNQFGQLGFASQTVYVPMKVSGRIRTLNGRRGKAVQEEVVSQVLSPNDCFCSCLDSNPSPPDR